MVAFRLRSAWESRALRLRLTEDAHGMFSSRLLLGELEEVGNSGEVGSCVGEGEPEEERKLRGRGGECGLARGRSDSKGNASREISDLGNRRDENENTACDLPAGWKMAARGMPGGWKTSIGGKTTAADATAEGRRGTLAGEREMGERNASRREDRLTGSGGDGTPGGGKTGSRFAGRMEDDSRRDAGLGGWKTPVGGKTTTAGTTTEGRRGTLAGGRVTDEQDAGRREDKLAICWQDGRRQQEGRQKDGRRRQEGR